MAKINVTNDILKHDDEEIIDLLFETMKGIRLAFNEAMGKSDPSIAYTAYGDVLMVTDVLRKLNRRNEEKAVQ